MMKKIIRIAVCYQARSHVEAGKSGSQLYGFHVSWIDYDEEMCGGACVKDKDLRFDQEVKYM